jgi:intracellular sulfur oxidation DsrE/DsrF family protein
MRPNAFHLPPNRPACRALAQTRQLRTGGFMLASLLLAAALLLPEWARANEAPWGHAQAVKQTYAKQKVVYDVTTGSESTMRGVISRAMLLADLNGSDPFDSKVVILLHGNEIPFFAIKNFPKYRELMQRAQGATQSGVIEFRMCRLAAEMHGFQPEDIHGFVTLVPMADTEIVRLQQEGYAYMR